MLIGLGVGPISGGEVATSQDSFDSALENRLNHNGRDLLTSIRSTMIAKGTC